MRKIDYLTFPVGRRGIIGPSGQYYKASTFLEQDYYNRYKAWHTGEDWNDIRGGNSDDGAPFYCIGHGVIEAMGFYPTWGNIILVKHMFPKGLTFWSMYAHGRYMLPELEIGTEVKRDEVLGTIGRGANDRFYAHLHFEIRLENLPPDNWLPMVKNYNEVKDNYTDPTQWITQFSRYTYPRIWKNQAGV